MPSPARAPHARPRNLRESRARRVSEINVVPYVDVLLVLLVIFMVTVPVLRSGVEVKLPKAGGEALRDSLLPVVVSVDANGSYYLNTYRDPTQAIDGEFLKRRVKGVLDEYPRTPVIVKADEKTSFGTVISVMSLLKAAGAADVGLMMRRPGSQGDG
ncbi:MAG: ExbD/TolR family protein [Betaproteobacteria bacterium]